MEAAEARLRKLFERGGGEVEVPLGARLAAVDDSDSDGLTVV